MPTSTPPSISSLGAATQAAQENIDVFSNEVSNPYWDTVLAKDVGANWNKSFPFQLLLLKQIDDSYQVESRFTLPIPPESLRISTPFAIEVDVTMGGVLEQHNGAPIRDIVLTGTTGVLPLRGVPAKPTELESQFSGIFAGTVAGARQTANAVRTSKTLLGDKIPGNIVTKNELEGIVGSGSGFHQFLLLKHFLESYAERKRRGQRNLRLGFAIWKENEVYLVTPRSFDVDRNAGRALEYPFTLSMRAWKRIVINTTTSSAPYTDSVGASTPSAMAQVMSLLSGARMVLEGARKTLSGVRADVQNVLLSPMRQTMLFAADSIGLIVDATYFPADIIADLREPLLEASTRATSVSSFARSKLSSDAINAAFAALAVSSGKADTQSGRDSYSSSFFDSSQNKNKASKANKALENPNDHFEFFATIRPSDLNLRPATIQKIETERKNCRALRRADFEKFRDDAVRVLDDFSDFVGAGDTTYTQTYRLPSRTTTRTPTKAEWDVIHALNTTIQQYDCLAASAKVDVNQLSSIDYIAGLASRSGIAFQVPVSKFAVPFPYGFTLEQLSARYLGTPDRWHEIAALNGLKAPYVDEIGVDIPFGTNGMGLQIFVLDARGLYVGQKVWLESTQVLRESRRIQDIQPSGSGFVVWVNGAPDLEKFKTLHSAKIHTFLPDTVNSQQQIYIPSDKTPREIDFETKDVPGVDQYDPLIKSCGVDLLLDSQNDIVMGLDGGSKLAVGLTNQIQKIKTVLATPKGALMHHPDYGISIKPGDSTADVSAQQILADLNQLFKDDPSFTGVTGVSVSKQSGYVSVRMFVGIAGVSQYIPVQVNINPA